jgi:hypothetical protein
MFVNFDYGRGSDRSDHHGGAADHDLEYPAPNAEEGR